MRFWYKKVGLHWLLLPLSALFWLISQIRKALYQQGFLRSYRAPVPVIIVGNLTVGGNGKTPVVIWLVQQLQQQGLKVGVISRGYGSQSKIYPLLVNEHSDPILAGDEPVLIAKRTKVPVCISPNRQQAIELLLETQNIDVIISDDGLQHYKLQRDLEIVVIDGERQFGNGFLLPAGPLRELPTRLKQVDLIISNGKLCAYSDTLMQLKPQYAVNLKTGEKRAISDFIQGNAIAGIGNPTRFFTMLEQLGIVLKRTKAFQDHQAYSLAQLCKFDKNTPLFMTEKDAVKCVQFTQENWWAIPIEAQINTTPQIQEFFAKLKNILSRAN
ncbi:tetraacyldisaccharide 4'-kinase [[Haemophilus] felis]|nr:tetraacyldisaccharide 4'-kinase [[Haemophilus] felis]